MSQGDYVLAVGAAGLDVIASLGTDLVSGTSNPARMRTSYGGVARNVAENLARLGQPVRLVTAVGNDRTGQEILEYTRAAGVDTQAAICCSDLPSGFYFGILDGSGRLIVALDDMRALEAVTAEAVSSMAYLIQSARLVFMDANLQPAALKTVLRLAKKAKVPVCIDPTSTRLAGRLTPFLKDIWLLTPNGAEAGLLAGMNRIPDDPASALEAARALVGLGVETALVTMAEFGVVYATSTTNGHIPAIRTQINDPTGGGDALCAALIFGLLNDILLDDAIRLGVSAASLTLRCQGTVNPELTLERLYAELLI